ncbi:hypothetical protein T4E_10074 [Trichinella pseudospiralis]|uniref:Uncharacterized protein n=1 Tax=Trichinella pseudospiralis TaxID=6337 RepID=A0A0V0Y0L9_TRIPS|nr:hypothetical protein T4E_10074 [Trichinella pseudospiralis]
MIEFKKFTNLQVEITKINQPPIPAFSNREEWPFGTSIETRNKEKNDTQRGRERKKERERESERRKMKAALYFLVFLYY